MTHKIAKMLYCTVLYCTVLYCTVQSETMKVDDDRDCDLVNEHVPSHIERID
jgi:hypothetical protein